MADPGLNAGRHFLRHPELAKDQAVAPEHPFIAVGWFRPVSPAA
jgi:hypothetical protein